MDDQRRVEFVLVPDSADTRLFIELSSYAADLTEARDALTLALSAGAPNSGPPDGVERSLIANAVMAYCRTFFPSKVRTPVTSFVQVPEELVATHNLVARFRNRTIAHSQSDLSVTYPIGVLDAKTLSVLDLSAPTVCSTMPTEQVNSFIALVDEIQRRLDDVIEPIRDRLKAMLTDADRAALVERGPRPTGHLLPAQAFANPATRPPYPGRIRCTSRAALIPEPTAPRPARRRGGPFVARGERSTGPWRPCACRPAGGPPRVWPCPLMTPRASRPSGGPASWSTRS